MRRHEPDLNVDKHELKEHELTGIAVPQCSVQTTSWDGGFSVPWVRLACGRVHFSEVSDMGSMRHFVDLGEI